MERIFFCLSPLVLFITFVNPLFAGFVSSYITTAEVYWRLFWLLPVYVVPTAFLTETAVCLFEGRLQKGFAAVLLVLALLIGYRSETYYVLSPSLAENTIKSALKITAPRRENPYAVSAQTMDIVTAVINDWDGNNRPRLLTKYDGNFEIRQCSSEIITYWAGQHNPVPGLQISQSELIREYEHYDEIRLYDALKAINANYVCIKSGFTDLTGNSNFRYILTSGDLILWKVL